MNASASEEILAYHESTKHSPGSVRASRWVLDSSNKPAPFKLYQGCPRIDLPADARPGDLPTLDAIARVATGDARVSELSVLSPLLVFGAGIHHAVRYADGDVWHFRTYASAGALHPNEVYVVAGDLDGMAAGVYHFLPSGPALVRLRAGEHRPRLVQASAREPSVTSADVVVVITGIPWRTAWKYAERGYRHLFWDAGMILANVLALAAAAGVPARVVVGFVDADVEALLAWIRAASSLSASWRSARRGPRSSHLRTRRPSSWLGRCRCRAPSSRSRRSPGRTRREASEYPTRSADGERRLTAGNRRGDMSRSARRTSSTPSATCSHAAARPDASETSRCRTTCSSTSCGGRRVGSRRTSLRTAHASSSRI